MIDNTTARMKNDPAEPLLFMAASMAPGGSDEFIGAQEAAGQAQLVHSDRLPTDLHSPREDFEAQGFTFGDPDPSDPMFAPATLPEGWSRQGSDHDMWSYIVDDLGRRRASVFYKAAFYDRRADMSLDTVWAYVSGRVYDDQPIITDDGWATPAAVLAELRNGVRQAEERIAEWTGIGGDSSTRYIAQYTAERDKYQALATTYESAETQS